jgi:hypothetical protein
VEKPLRIKPSHTVAPCDYIDETMTRSEIVAVLDELRFKNSFATVEIDRASRDFIVAALRGK